MSDKAPVKSRTRRKCGHDPTPENTIYTTKNGKRVADACRPCRRAWERAAADRKNRAVGAHRRQMVVTDPDTKRCTNCDEEKPLEAFYPRSGRQGGYSRGRTSQCIACHRGGTLAWERANVPDVLQRNREYLARLRWTALVHYSKGDEPECACCGETELVFLALDHVKNDGAEHRRALRKAGQAVNLPRALARAGWPDGYQVLCSNCNWAKHALGACPHSEAVGKLRAQQLREVSSRPIRFRKFDPTAAEAEPSETAVWTEWTNRSRLFDT